VTLSVGGDAYTYEIDTEPLPVDFPGFTLHVSEPAMMAPGVTVFTAISESYSALLDCHAQVRGYLSNKRIAHGTSMIVLSSGNMLSTGDEYKQVPYNMATLFEYNWLGKVFRIYDVPNAVHHSICELPDGNILAVSNNADMFRTGTREDVVIVIDKETGDVIKTYDFREIIDEAREPFHHFHPDIINAPNRDWMHTNGAVYDAARNAVIVSSPTQSMVISIDADTSDINWILGPHDGYSEELSRYLLTPVGEGFEWHWCQHNPTLLRNDDPNVVDIMVFDNGQNKSFYEESATPAAENYSRAVLYRIDLRARTVRQLWQYGKERGPEYYATYLGSAQMLARVMERDNVGTPPPYCDWEAGGNVLIAFGGQIRKNGVPADDLTESVLGELITNSRVVEVTMGGGSSSGGDSSSGGGSSSGGEVVYEVSVNENAFTRAAGTYQASRIPLFAPGGYETLLGEAKGVRLGASYLCSPPAGDYAGFSIPPVYIGNLSAGFTVIQREGNRLVIDGTLLNGGETRLLSKAFVILRGKSGDHVYEANSGLHGRFFLSVDLSGLPEGEYLIAIAGATVEGNDALGKRSVGHFATGYKVTVG